MAILFNASVVQSWTCSLDSRPAKEVAFIHLPLRSDGQMKAHMQILFSLVIYSSVLWVLHKSWALQHAWPKVLFVDLYALSGFTLKFTHSSYKTQFVSYNIFDPSSTLNPKPTIAFPVNIYYCIRPPSLNIIPKSIFPKP
jgi:hypothetical protein